MRWSLIIDVIKYKYVEKGVHGNSDVAKASVAWVQGLQDKSGF